MDWEDVEGNEDSDEEEELESVLEKQHEEADNNEEDLSDSDSAGEWITPDNVD